VQHEAECEPVAEKTAPWSLSGEPRAASPDPVGKSPGMSYLAEADIEWD
jgi:hypothetical protein